MPSEYREIRFSGDELARALHDYALAQNPESPPRNPNGLKITSEPEIAVSLKFGNDHSTYSAAETTAAILRFARKTGVPIARRARKALAVKDNDLVLKLWID